VDQVAIGILKAAVLESESVLLQEAVARIHALPWQTAYVYDPVSGEESMFVWREGTPTRDAFLVEEEYFSLKPGQACTITCSNVSQIFAKTATSTGIRMEFQRQ
jgi:hypothetical protein